VTARGSTRTIAALLVLWMSHASSGQAPRGVGTRGLVGTWTLSSVERLNAASEPSAVPNPRGLLVFDAAGHVLEIVTRANRPVYAAAQPTPAEAQVTFASFNGFWGTYRVDEAQKKVAYQPEGAVNPNLMGEQLTRAYELTGDRLTVRALSGNVREQSAVRWVWDRVPTLADLSPANRRLLGFWQHVVEQRVNATSGAVISETRRAPSVIVYTPAGYVGVSLSSSQPPTLCI
jgi:hypothetical protein